MGRGYPIQKRQNPPTALSDVEVSVGSLGGAIGLYKSMLQEGDEIATLVAGHKLNIPVRAIGAGSGEFTSATMTLVSSNPVRSVLDGAWATTQP